MDEIFFSIKFFFEEWGAGRVISAPCSFVRVEVANCSFLVAAECQRSISFVQWNKFADDAFYFRDNSIHSVLFIWV